MKTILLWDPRFPDRRPARLTVEDTVASAAVRAGVAAAANPAEAGALAAGGALDPGTLTEVALQHGSGNAIRRVFIPYSVALVGAAAGVLAAIGAPLAGGTTPPPLPTLTLTGPLTYATNAAAGTLVANIGNVPAGVTPTLTPNDGRLVIAGSAGAWTVVTGLSASTAGTITLAVAAAGANGASVPVVVSGVDADTTAYISRMSVAPSTEQASAYDYFVTQAKAIGVWPYITDCGFLCAHDPQSAKLGLKNAINLTNVGGGPSHIPGYGMRGNGTSQALNTNYKIPLAQQNDTSVGLYNLTSDGSLSLDMGNSNVEMMLRRPTNDAYVSFLQVNGTGGASYTLLDPIGFNILSRTGPNGSDQAYSARGVQIAAGSITPSASATPDAVYPIWIGGSNRSTAQYSNRMLSFWHIGKGIPTSLHAAFAELVDEVCVRLSASYRTMPNLTAKTKSLYKYIVKTSRRTSYIFGAFDNTNWDPSARKLLPDILTITGKVPALLTMEWQDPASVRGTAIAAAQLTRIKDHYANGGIISLHRHCGNPVTGSLANSDIDLGVAPNTATGAQGDRNGAPLVAVLAGGSKRADFFAWVDRWIAFTQTCVDANGELIPLILRPFHEANQGGFWWSDTATQANTAQIRKDFVDRFRAASVTNVLFDVNYGTGTTNIGTGPGHTYCDILSYDAYNQDTGATAGIDAVDSAALRALCTTSQHKPLYFSELGYQTAAGTVSNIWTAKTGNVHRDLLSISSGFAPWHQPWGPAPGDANRADFAAMVAEANCITRDRLTGVYG